MDKSLAEELKNAKFPKCDAHTEHRYIDGSYYPTLGELIYACGDGIILFKTKSNWVAGIFGQGWDTWYIDGDLSNVNEGSTPEEAVAKLWKELNCF